MKDYWLDGLRIDCQGMMKVIRNKIDIKSIIFLLHRLLYEYMDFQSFSSPFFYVFYSFYELPLFRLIRNILRIPRNKTDQLLPSLHPLITFHTFQGVADLREFDHGLSYNAWF